MNGKPSKKIILLNSNADLTKAILVTMDWEIKKRPLYIPNLGPRDFSLFGPIMVYLGGQKFRNDYDLKCGVLYWLTLGMK
jgi:hypothetical protein